MQGKLTPSTFVRSEQEAYSHLNQVRRGLWWGFAVILVVTFLAGYLVYWSVGAKEEELVQVQKERLELLTSSRVDLVKAWFDNLQEHGNRVIRSDLFRLYTSEVALLGDDLSRLLGAPLPDSDDMNNLEQDAVAAQLPMMNQLLVEFTRYAGFTSGRVVNSSGQSYIATDASTTSLSGQRLAYAMQTLQKNTPLYAPMTGSPNGLLLDIYLPISPPMSEQTGEPPVAVLILSRPVSEKVSELAAKSPLLAAGHRTRLIQKTSQGFEEIIPWLPNPIRPLPITIKSQKGLPFSERTGLDGEQRVYSQGKRVPGTDLWVVQEVDFHTARIPLTRYQQISISLVALISVLFLLGLGALWWRFVGSANQKLAAQFRLLGNQIEEQRQLIENVNTNLHDGIALKDKGGIYQYVNPAFAQALGRQEEEIIGMDDISLFGFDTAKRLETSDQKVFQDGTPTTVNEQIYLQSKLHHLQISKAPYKTSENQIEGSVAVFRDITDIVQAREKSEQAVRQTINALATTIERTDPYLGGHSRLMSELSSLLAHHLGEGERETATVETAAYLSQIGKLFVPRDLLTKPETLTGEERRELEKHATYAGDILKEINFDLPVYPAVHQMNELLDGSGYPNGLSGQQIHRSARILAVANAFCAMVKPRAYRPARPLHEALTILQQQHDKYDQEVLAALESIVQSHEGEKVLGATISTDRG